MPSPARSAKKAPGKPPAAVKGTPKPAAASPAKPAKPAAPAKGKPVPVTAPARPRSVVAAPVAAPQSQKAKVTQSKAKNPAPKPTPDKAAAAAKPKAEAAVPAPAPAAAAKPAGAPAKAEAAPRKALSNAAAAQALMASAAASKAAAAAKAAEPPPPPAAPPASPTIPVRPGMSRPGMPGMRPAFSITPRLPMGALRSGGMAEGQGSTPGAKAAKVEFKAGDMVVYPTHGVGTVQGIDEVTVAGISQQMITITFEENRMTLRVPPSKAATAGLRKLAGPSLIKQALDTLKGRARIKRTMWSRRAQEYEAKINSGDPVAIAEVVRDLFRNAGQPDQSFSERQIYEQALDRLAMEFAAIEKTDKPTAIERLIAHMRSAEKPGKPPEDPIEED